MAWGCSREKRGGRADGGRLPAARRRCRLRGPGWHRAVCLCGDAGTPISSAMLLRNKLAWLAGSDELDGAAAATLQLQVGLLCWRGW